MEHDAGENQIIHISCRGGMLNLLRKSFPEWAALMGICFGIVFVKTESFYVAVAAHAFANLPDFVMPLFPELQFGVRIVLAVVTAVVSVVLLRMCSVDKAYVARQ